MAPFKEFLAKQLVGNQYHFKCDCILSLDVTGKVLDFEVQGSEIIFWIDANGKVIKIGSNHPNLMIEPLV